MADKFSRQGTARALVLLASGLAVAGAALVFCLALFLGPTFGKHGMTGAVLAGTAVFGAFSLVSAVAANLLAARASTPAAVAARGCGTLLVGIVLGLGTMLVLISRAG